MILPINVVIPEAIHMKHEEVCPKKPNVGFKDGGDDVERVGGRSMSGAPFYLRTLIGSSSLHWLYNPSNHLTIQHTQNTIANCLKPDVQEYKKARRSEMNEESVHRPASDEIVDGWKRVRLCPSLLFSFSKFVLTSYLNKLDG